MTSYKRLLDILFSVVVIAICLPIFALVAIVVKLTSEGPILHWSVRVGKENRLFFMPKFRSMRVDTPQVATHLLSDPTKYLTRVGRVLRMTSLDELPQVFSILLGHLSFVGPRPALFNQDDLVRLRTERGVHLLVPGLTGWAQVNGRDELSIEAKAALDYEYLQKQSLGFDLRILLMTAVKLFNHENISH